MSLVLPPPSQHVTVHTRCNKQLLVIHQDDSAAPTKQKCLLVCVGAVGLHKQSDSMHDTRCPSTHDANATCALHSQCSCTRRQIHSADTFIHRVLKQTYTVGHIFYFSLEKPDNKESYTMHIPTHVSASFAHMLTKVIQHQGLVRHTTETSLRWHQDCLDHSAKGAQFIAADQLGLVSTPAIVSRATTDFYLSACLPHHTTLPVSCDRKHMATCILLCTSMLL